MQLSKEYFLAVRGKQDQIRDNVKELKAESHYCVYCQRKTAVSYTPSTSFGQTMVVQLICPKCKREILTAISFRLAG